MSSQPGVSSVDKIFQHLAECPEFKDVRVLWHERLVAEPDIKYQFEYSKNYTKNTYEVTTEMHVKNGACSNRIHGLSDKNVEYTPNFVGLLTDDEALQVVKRNFGTKRCKTYNCKIDRIIKGDDRRHHRKNGFADWARIKLKEEFPQALEDHMVHVRNKTRSILNSEQFAKDKKKFFERHVIDEIRTVVLKYLDLVEIDVIKEAMQEVYVASIMES